MALTALSEIPARRRIAVLGEVAEPPSSQGPMYRKLGEQVARLASRIVFVGGSSTWTSLSSGARRAGLPPESLVNVGRSVLKAVEALRHDLRPGDVVLIKGRDTQRFDRINLALMGQTVRCNVSFCNAKVRCGTCPMLAREWNGFRQSPEDARSTERASVGGGTQTLLRKGD